MIEAGMNYDAAIVSHGLNTISTQKGDTDIVRFLLDVEGDQYPAVIWLTPKAMGIARAQLKKCGFDIDARLLTDLEDDQTLLAGNIVPVEVEEYKGKLQVRILAREPIKRERFSALTESLRAAKQSGEEPVSGSHNVVADDDIPFESSPRR